jgi:hypothetical protein
MRIADRDDRRPATRGSIPETPAMAKFVKIADTRYNVDQITRWTVAGEQAKSADSVTMHLLYEIEPGLRHLTFTGPQANEALFALRRATADAVADHVGS